MRPDTLNISITDLEESLVAQGYPMMVGEMKEYKEKGYIPYYDHYDNTVSVYDLDGERVKVLKDVIPKSVNALANCKPSTGHDSFLKGIGVSFDKIYSAAWTPQFQRYHFHDVVSSSSLMQRLTKMNIEDQVHPCVDRRQLTLVKEMIDAYNKCTNVRLRAKREGYTVSHMWIVSNGEGYELDYILMNDRFETLINAYEDNKLVLIDPVYKWTPEEFYEVIVMNVPLGVLRQMRVNSNALQLKTIILQREHHKLSEWREFVKVVKKFPFWRYFNMYQPTEEETFKGYDDKVSWIYKLIHLLVKGKNVYVIYDEDRKLQAIGESPELNGIEYEYTDPMNILDEITNESERLKYIIDWELDRVRPLLNRIELKRLRIENAELRARLS